MKSPVEHELKSLASPTQREVLMRFFKTGKGQYGEGDVLVRMSPEDQNPVL